MSHPSPIFALLALCARAQGHAAHTAALRQQAAALRDWHDLPGLAEVHGLAPLVAHHLHTARVAVPAAVTQQLRAYALHYAHQSQVQLQVLGEILTAYQAAGIPVLVLKGAALSSLVYPRPGLRSMRDLDLLVPADAAHRAHALLADLGCTMPPSPTHGLWEGHHHLAAARHTQQGVLVSVEVHHQLDLAEAGRPQRHFAEFIDRAQSLTINGVAAHALSREDMLWHVYRHAFALPVGYESLRLIWVADLVSSVEGWLDQIDWERVRRVYPAVARTLPLLHHLTPWSPAVIERLQLAVDRRPRGVGQGFDGWPRRTFAQQRPTPWWQVAWASVCPSPWWRGLHYGYGPGRADHGRAWWAHQRWLWPLVAVNARFHLGHHAAHRRLVLRLRLRARLQRRRARGGRP